MDEIVTCSICEHQVKRDWAFELANPRGEYVCEGCYDPDTMRLVIDEEEAEGQQGE